VNGECYGTTHSPKTLVSLAVDSAVTCAVDRCREMYSKDSCVPRLKTLVSLAVDSALTCALAP